MTHTYTIALNAKIAADKAAHDKKQQSTLLCYTLVKQFLNQNSSWPLDSIVIHLLATYKDFHITPAIVSECINDYIMDRH